MDALIEALDAHGAAISGLVIAEMYQHPFWRERFGDRGRKHADQDGSFHVSYLREALVSGDSAVFVRYARWLQSVLTSRRMCTHHLADNLIRLGDALARELSGGERARDVLHEASVALRAESGPARRLQDAADAIVAALDARPWPRDGVSDRALVTETHRELVSYLADAVAQDRPALFTDHVVWLSSFWERRGVSPSQLDARLAELSAHLAEHHGPAREAREVISGARARLEARHAVAEAPR